MTEPATILIVDDEKHTRDGLRAALEDEFDVYVASSAAEAAEVLKSDNVDVLLTDLRLGADDGMKVLEDSMKLPKPPVAIMMTAYGSVDTAVEAMRRGAWHFVTKPLNLDEVDLLVKRAIRSRKLEKENVVLKQQVERKFSVQGILGQSEVMKPIISTIEQVAPSRASVLIEGETGTGKELVARAIHHLSGRPASKLVIVHCAALSPQLLESELFGHEKGAFTGASDKRIGRFELADGGTLVLDEIGEIEPSTQVKLLRALGEQTIERVGSSKPIKIDVRVVAATNKNLARLVEEGKFREDLYWRLRVVSVQMPPLRERKSDIALLAEHFAKDAADANGKPYKPLSDEVWPVLMNYDWPGNVRELRTVIEHGVVMCNTNRIMIRHLPGYLSGGSGLAAPRLAPTQGVNPENGAVVPPSLPDDLNLEGMERRFIHAALQRAGNNRTEAAELLGISRRTLHRKIAEMDVAARKRKKN
ncbi:MAG: sigma-54-dependent Fis family transcriptional regulator [Verrucomicrobiaceae bacterium]|nr:sigma-54-dependent Fis family transcriptional regulator [Verrucomicrobiaceae bacterium]